MSSAGAINAPPTNFTDPTGDSGTAPDITNVSVTNDDHGLYTFTISFATPYVNADTLALAIDSDNNDNTGDPQALGADYVFADDYSSHSFDARRVAVEHLRGERRTRRPTWWSRATTSP